MDNILRNDIFLNTFKKGIEAFKIRNDKFDISKLFDDNTHLQYTKENELQDLIYYIWNKGYEFASKYPMPEIIEGQYNILKEKTLGNIEIEKIKQFIQNNQDIHIYLDEKVISKDTKSLNGFEEIEYSYGHIVAKANISDIKNNQLPLNGEILVFDGEGINEIARCKINEYSKIYNEKVISEMLKGLRNFEKENCIEEENEEIEQEE